MISSMSWMAAMQQIKICGDRKVLAAHKDELEGLQSAQPHVGVSNCLHPERSGMYSDPAE